MIQVPSERRRADGSLVYPHKILDGSQAPEAVSLLRQTLAKQPEQTHINNSDLDPNRDFVITVKRAA